MTSILPPAVVAAPGNSRPAARSYHAMVSDAGSDLIVLFGGWAGGSTGETWTYDYDANEWIKKDPPVSPSPRDAHGMAYDALSKRVILFGGIDATFTPLNDTWVYDSTTNTWTNKRPSVSPPARLGARMVYDASADRIILFGGHNGQCFGDTWAYDFDSNAWTNLRPAGPSPRAWQAMAYDVESHRTVLFGGDRCTGSGAGTVNDTWTYDLLNNTWAATNPAGNPAQRGWGAAAYDSQSDRVVLFGGDPSGPDETWTYDLNTNAWRMMDVAPRPSERVAHAMAYDEESDRIVLFGGVWPNGLVTDPALTHNNETWAYDFNTNAWTLLIEPTPPGISALTVGLLVAAGIVGVGAAAAILWRRRKKS